MQPGSHDRACDKVAQLRPKKKFARAGRARTLLPDPMAGPAPMAQKRVKSAGDADQVYIETTG